MQDKDSHFLLHMAVQFQQKSFVEEIVFSPLCSLGTFTEDQLMIKKKGLFYNSVGLHWSLRLTFCHHCLFFQQRQLSVCFGTRKCEALFFLFEVILVFQDPSKVLTFYFCLFRGNTQVILGAHSWLHAQGSLIRDYGVPGIKPRSIARKLSAILTVLSL